MSRPRHRSPCVRRSVGWSFTLCVPMAPDVQRSRTCGCNRDAMAGEKNGACLHATADAPAKPTRASPHTSNLWRRAVLPSAQASNLELSRCGWADPLLSSTATYRLLGSWETAVEMAPSDQLQDLQRVPGRLTLTRASLDQSTLKQLHPEGLHTRHGTRVAEGLQRAHHHANPWTIHPTQRQDLVLKLKVRGAASGSSTAEDQLLLNKESCLS